MLPSGDVLLHYLGGKSERYQLFTFTLCFSGQAVGVFWVSILKCSLRNMPSFLDNVHIVEAVKQPVDDSGSERAEIFVNTDVFEQIFLLILIVFNNIFHIYIKIKV